jgi:hypothetical protein
VKWLTNVTSRVMVFPFSGSRLIAETSIDLGQLFILRAVFNGRWNMAELDYDKQAPLKAEEPLKLKDDGRVQVEFRIDDLMNELKVDANSGVGVLGCMGCSNCS